MDIKLEGFAELQQQLRGFGPAVEKNGTRNATRAAAVVFRDAIRARLNAGPRPISRTHTLETNLYVASRRSKTGPNVIRYGVKVRPAKKRAYGDTKLNRRKQRVGKKYSPPSPAFYGRFLEFGTSRMRAMPFMRPAFGPAVPAALAAFKARMARAVQLATRKKK